MKKTIIFFIIFLICRSMMKIQKWEYYRNITKIFYQYFWSWCTSSNTYTLYIFKQSFSKVNKIFYKQNAFCLEFELVNKLRLAVQSYTFIYRILSFLMNLCSHLLISREVQYQLYMCIRNTYLVHDNKDTQFFYALVC